MRVLIVDGHSMIFAWPEMLKMHTQRRVLARDAMVKTLTAFQDYSGVHVVVVFDGKGLKSSEATEPGGIQIFYSGDGQTADDIIERLVAGYGRTHEITVATNDRLEQQTVTTFGALAISSDGLRDMLEESSRALARDLKKFRPR